MALETNELYSSNTAEDQLRLFPADHGIMPKTFDAVAGGASLVQGVPVSFNTSTSLWEVFTQGGTNGTNVISGILMEPITLDDSGGDDNEVLGNVMILGVMHRDDINTAAIRALCGGSPTEGNLDTALGAATMREKGLIVEGLATAQ
jgi:hypothetical protein